MFIEAVRSCEAIRKLVGDVDPSIWPALYTLWEDLSNLEIDYQLHMKDVTMAVARFTRNLLPECPENQALA